MVFELTHRLYHISFSMFSKKSQQYPTNIVLDYIHYFAYAFRLTLPVKEFCKL